MELKVSILVYFRFFVQLLQEDFLYFDFWMF